MPIYGFWKERKLAIKSAMHLLGTPYVWGGNLPHEGIDCSGFVIFVELKPFGIMEENEDKRAIDLYEMLKECVVENPYKACLVFYDNFKHVELCIDETYSIGATQGAVQLRRIRRKGKKIEAFVDPFMKEI